METRKAIQKEILSKIGEISSHNKKTIEVDFVFLAKCYIYISGLEGVVKTEEEKELLTAIIEGNPQTIEKSVKNITSNPNALLEYSKNEVLRHFVENVYMKCI